MSGIFGVPKEKSECILRIATENEREGLHIYIGKHVEINGEDVYESHGVHLTREDARKLMK